MNEIERWDRARTLLLESLYKPDNHLRSCSHNQECYDELMSIRDKVIEMVRGYILVETMTLLSHTY